MNIPHPYTPSDAREWIAQHEFLRQTGEEYVFAITERDSAHLAGATSLRVKAEHNHAELGYWVGRPFQGRGYASEAAGAMLELGFLGLGLHRVFGRHLAWNTASSGVLLHIGMTPEGTMRGHACKWGVYHDVHVYGITSDEFMVRYTGRQSDALRSCRGLD